MRIINSIIIILFISGQCIAQEKVKIKPKEKDPVENSEKNNVIKINLPALAFKNISIQYERKIGRKTSVAVNIHTIPFGKLPFQSAFKNVGGSSDVQYSQFKLGSFGIVPEFRYYLGKKGALRGFYVGPFVSYSSYKMNLPINYNNNTKTGIFDGKLSAFTGGLQLGAQFKLGKNMILDWWILGPNYGSANGTLTLTTALSASDQSDLKTKLEQLKNDAPLNTIQSYTVTSTGASIVAKGPWGGLRGLGFNLGIRF
jgi:hypothetical protein